MSKNKHEIYLPTVCARGIVVFPNQKVLLKLVDRLALMQ